MKCKGKYAGGRSALRNGPVDSGPFAAAVTEKTAFSAAGGNGECIFTRQNAQGSAARSKTGFAFGRFRHFQVLPGLPAVFGLQAFETAVHRVADDHAFFF